MDNSIIEQPIATNNEVLSIKALGNIFQKVVV